MQIIEQTIDIPAKREIFLKLPQTVPEGRATITISINEYEKTGTREIPSLEKLKLQAAKKTAYRKASGKKPFEGLYGILKDSTTFAGDPVEIVKKLREEWDVAR
jgi:hypothetical protein